MWNKGIKFKIVMIEIICYGILGMKYYVLLKEDNFLIVVVYFCEIFFF